MFDGDEARLSASEDQSSGRRERTKTIHRFLCLVFLEEADCDIEEDDASDHGTFDKVLYPKAERHGGDEDECEGVCYGIKCEQRVVSKSEGRRTHLTNEDFHGADATIPPQTILATPEAIGQVLSSTVLRFMNSLLQSLLRVCD